MFNDYSQSGTTSKIETKDKFWLPTGNYSGDQLLSADPSYDLSDNNTYIQKVKNDKVNNWKNIILTPLLPLIFLRFDSLTTILFIVKTTLEFPIVLYFQVLSILMFPEAMLLLVAGTILVAVHI